MREPAGARCGAGAGAGAAGFELPERGGAPQALCGCAGAMRCVSERRGAAGSCFFRF